MAIAEDLTQRERLLDGLVAAVAERGYEATTVADVLAASGLSRTAFYANFENKQACFLAALERVLEAATHEVALAYAQEGPYDVRLRRVLEAFTAFVASHPEAAHVTFVDYYAVGPPAMDRAEDATTALTALILHGFQEVPERAGIPPLVVRGLIGGIRKITHSRLRRGEGAELPDLVPELLACLLCYFTPPVPLRRPRVRPAAPAPPAVADPAERVFAALARSAREKGYAATTVADLASGASMSLSTFYGLFDGKQAAFLAAYESATAQALAATVPPFRRSRDWPHGVRAGLAGFLEFCARSPEWAHLAVVEVLAAGPEAMERRDAALDALAALLRPGLEHAPDAPPIVFELIGGAIFNLMFDHVRRRGAQRLPELLPVATVLALSPFVGSDAAVAIANERGTGVRSRRADRAAGYR